MKKPDYILSYLYPVTVEVTSSRYNPVLEIVLYAGKYSLNSENTNYSYGSLYTLFKKIFSELNLNWMEINDVLILGFGTGCIAELTGKYKPGCKIEGVEIDEKVIELGEKYFGTRSLKNVTIHCTHAGSYFGNSGKKFDLIIIDVFLDMIVPPELETEEFLLSVRNALNRGGMVIFNKVIYSKSISDQIPPLRDLYQRIFGNLQILTVMESGKIFVARI